MALPQTLQTDAFFLSATNPIATADQRDMEALALQIVALPRVQAARAMAAQRWKICVGRDVPEEAWPRFESLMDEWVYHYVLKAVNADANYPKVLGHLFGPPHEWFGMKVPGSRSSGGDNPDSNMSIVPIDASARFELHGQRFAKGVADVPITLCANLSLSSALDNLDWADVDIGADGKFVITLDPQPANGRRNHIHTRPDARWLFIRDCRGDWSEMPNAYRIHRLDPPTAPPLTLEQMAERAVRYIVEDVPMMQWVMRAAMAVPTNMFSPPVSSAGVGGMATQMLSMANLKLADDEALVVTVGAGGARYTTFVLHDFWFRTLDCWNNTSTANTSQGIANADGSKTYVVSLQDPGVHNWLDTAGMHQLMVLHRWQGVPANLAAGGGPSISAQLTKLQDLDAALPAGTKRVTTAERREQIAERRQSFALRYVDH